VVTFADADVNRLINLLKPDVHCKGTDYTVDTVPERGVVAGYGGRTVIVGDPKSHATRELLARIARAKEQAPGIQDPDRAPR
jgi:bifunctional ADP-heptose synthase (sugar kinase/adenylyltransferase)